MVDYIDEHREDVIEYLRQLIRVPSVNPWFHDDPGPSNEDLVQDLIAASVNASKCDGGSLGNPMPPFGQVRRKTRLLSGTTSRTDLTKLLFSKGTVAAGLCYLPGTLMS